MFCSSSAAGEMVKGDFAVHLRRSVSVKPLSSQTRMAMHLVRFGSGKRIGKFAFSPQFQRKELRALNYWINRLEPSLLRILPPLKMASVDRLTALGPELFINHIPQAGRKHFPGKIHAASFIPQRYIVFHHDLFQRRIELGRIAYHELCHFLWLRLGNSRREIFAELLKKEFDEKVKGELGYSSEWRKFELQTAIADRANVLPRAWRDYVCESFCDTGSFVLLDDERRQRHSEFTLRKAARERRCRLWKNLVSELSERQSAKT